MKAQRNGAAVPGEHILLRDIARNAQVQRHGIGSKGPRTLPLAYGAVGGAAAAAMASAAAAMAAAAAWFGSPASYTGIGTGK